MSELLRRLRWMFGRRRFERELDEEMQHHLAMRMEAGSQRKFGNVALLKEESRAMWNFGMLEQLGQDVRYGLRAMWGSKVFTAMAVLSLALGIGANTAIYSFLHAILLRSLPVAHPERLVTLNWIAAQRPAVVHGLNGSMFREGTGVTSPNMPFAAYETLRQNKDVLSPLFAYGWERPATIVPRNQAELSAGMYVSGSFGAGLGLVPAAGRFIVDDDDRSGAPPVAVITYDLWKRRFGLDPSAVGQPMLINTVPFTIIGVAPRGFAGVDSSFEPAVFMPLHARPLFSRRPAEEEKRLFFNKNFHWVAVIGRLQPGVSRQQAQTVMGSIYRRYMEELAITPAEKTTLPDLRVQDGAGGSDSLRRQFAKPLYVLMSMVGLILVIACANIANLLLARASARRREIAIRLSLGAGRMRVIRQLLTESVLLSATGGLAGIAVAAWAIRSIKWLLFDGSDQGFAQVSLDWPVLAFTAGLALLTGILFGLMPAIQATGDKITPALKEARIGRAGRASRTGMRHALVMMQLAISLLLVVAAGLFARSLLSLHAVDIGFNRDNVLIFSVNARQAGYKDETLARFYGQLTRTFRGIPGVQSAGFSDLPLVAHYANDDDVTIPGAPVSAGSKHPTSIVSVDDSFLPTMQIPVLLGRGIEARDIAAPRTVVVSQAFADKFFRGETPVGRHIQLGRDRTDLEIVGVARTTIYNSLREEASPVVYLPYTLRLQQLSGVWFELRTAGNPLGIANAVREAVHRAASTVPVANMKTQAAQVDQNISQERTLANLCLSFALLALVIACVGLYGMTAYAAQQRTSEIGIRIALGAERREIVWMMLRQVLVLALAGLAIGLLTAWQTAHLVSSFLYGVQAWDPVAFWGSAAVLLFAALLAAYAPARRAARLDPMVALRNE